MTAIAIIVAALAVLPDEAGGVAKPAVAPVASSPAAGPAHAIPPAQPPATSLPRSGKPLIEAVRVALRHPKPADIAEIDGHARELLGLFREVQADQSLAPSVRRSLQSQLRSRLLAVADQIERRAAGLRRPSRQGSQGGDAKAEAISTAQPAATPASPRDEKKAKTAVANVAKDRCAVLAQQAAPAAAGGAGGTAARPRDDYGEELAQLIRETVAPQSWDTAGGGATVRYWRPGRALIIRQTNENHDDIADVLEQLDRMSR